MRRNWFSRSLASVFAVWLATCMVEPMQLHTCAMHGGLALEQTSGPHGHPASHGTAMHVGQPGHDHGTDGHSHQCSCLGDCNSGSAPVGLTASAVSLSEPGVVDNAASSFSYSSPRLLAASYFLPFSNGPPSSSSRA